MVEIVLLVETVETPDNVCGSLNVMKLLLFTASKVTANFNLLSACFDTKYLLCKISFPWLSVNPIPDVT